MSELSDRLARLAQRGTERGADAVFAAAQADNAEATRNRFAIAGLTTRPLTALTAIAASVMLLGGVAAAVRINSRNDTPTHGTFAAPRTTTTTGEPTSPTTATTVGAATKVYLASTRLVPFDQCPALSRYAQAKALDVVGPYGLPGVGGGGYPMPMMANDAARTSAEGDKSAQSAPSAAAGGASPEFSTTNVQEAGIDEPDSVKTDGKTIFNIAQGKVFATAAGANPSLVGSLAVDQGAQQLLLVGNRLIVISGGGGYYATDMRGGGGSTSSGIAKSSMPYPGGSMASRFTVVDVSDPAAMKATGSFDIDGSYVSARLVDGIARLVVRSNPQFDFAYPTDGSPEAQAKATEHNRAVVRAATVDSWLPHYAFTDASGNQTASRPLSTCSDSYRPPTFAGFGMLSVVTFNAAKPTDSRTTSVMADGDIVYASAKRLYVATNSWGEVTNNEVRPSANTLIHAFDISDPSNAAYLRSGRVRGTVLNQFSMSEYAGALRVATTDAAGGSESFLTVLGDAGNALVQIGQVGGLGRGERIYAVRFIDKVAYVVTFRQVDPLYVIDLSDPTRPRVVGELPLTGYSAYLHPIGPGLLLGVGQEATTDGHRVGIQASIFDVTNPAAPRLVARKVLEQGSSSVEFDHHAFLYWPATKLAVFPISTYSEQGSTFNGAVGLRVGDASLDEVGRVQPPDGQMYGGVERSLVIGNRLYATSYRGVLVATLDNLTQTAWVAYPSNEPNQSNPSSPPKE